MSSVYSLLTAAIADNNARTGKRVEGQVYLTKGPGSEILVQNANDRIVWCHERDAHGTSRPPFTLTVSMDFGIQMVNSRQYENMLCDWGFEAGDSRPKVLRKAAITGGTTPGEAASAANSFPANANTLDLRVQAVASSVEFEVKQGAYYNASSGISNFSGATTASAETNSIADQVASLASGEHVVVWICLNVSTGRLDTVAGTPQTVSGTAPSRAELRFPDIINGVTIPFPLIGIVPVYVYKGETASSDEDVYRAYDARGAFGSPPTPGGAITTSGTATLVLGVATITTVAVTANSLIFLTPQETGVISGFLHVSARTPGTSFAIASSVLTDTAVVAWMILEP